MTPDRPGTYWLLTPDWGRWVAVEVFSDAGYLCVCMAGDRSSVLGDVEMTWGEWGPRIESPAEAEERRKREREEAPMRTPLDAVHAVWDALGDSMDGFDPEAAWKSCRRAG